MIRLEFWNGEAWVEVAEHRVEWMCWYSVAENCDTNCRTVDLETGKVITDKSTDEAKEEQERLGLATSPVGYQIRSGESLTILDWTELYCTMNEVQSEGVSKNENATDWSVKLAKKLSDKGFTISRTGSKPTSSG